MSTKTNAPATLTRPGAGHPEVSRMPATTYKQCRRCEERHPRDNFARCKSNSDGLKSWCKDCDREYHKQRYGISMEEYEALLAKGCAICGATEHLGLDHDHQTGEIREALCRSCNSGIGMLRDDADRVRAALAYLEKHRGNA
jgi:hypothetical protein